MAAHITVAPTGPRQVLTGGAFDLAGDVVAEPTHDGQPPTLAVALSARPILVLGGELTHASAPSLEAAIERICAQGASRITLDLRKLTAIDWAGIMVISFRCRLCLERGHEIALIAGPPAVQDAFARVGLLAELPFVKLGGEC